MSTFERSAVEPEYIIDSEGRKTKVILSVEAYEELLAASQQRGESQAQGRTFSSLGAGENANLQGAETHDLISRAWDER